MSPGDAGRLLDAYATGQLLEPFAAGLELDAAYAIAEEVHQDRLARGQRPLGRKIGFSNRAIWGHFGVDAPIWAYVYDATTIQVSDGRARTDPAPLLQPQIEPEIQLHLASPPPPGGDEEALLACVDWLALGFELVQCPYPGWRFTTPDAIAASSLHGRLVLGTPVEVAGIDECAERLRSCRVVLSRDGEDVAEGRGANALDSPLLALGELATVLAAQRCPLEAGEIVTTGTLTMPQPVGRGETWAVRAEGLPVPSAQLELGAD
jgi:2-oxo-3-hexenedioate decarboxylase